MHSSLYKFLKAACVVLFSAASVLGASTISGLVFDRQRNPLPNVDVELLDDFYQTKLRTLTDGTGRYQFSGLPDGRYTVRVRAFRYDLQDQEIPIEILTRNIRGGEGTGHFQQDFYLAPRKGGLAESEIGVVFAQEVPLEARKSYELAVKAFAEKRTIEAVAALNKAIQLFPHYYLALHRMGKELFLAQNYKDSVPFLIRAVEVNSKSATSFYYLGYALYKLGNDYDNAALISLKNAESLAPASVQVLYVLGVVARRMENYSEAEAFLLKAKKQSADPVAEIHKELAQLYADNLHEYAKAANELESYLKVTKMEGAAAVDTKKVIAGLRKKAQEKGKN